MTIDHERLILAGKRILITSGPTFAPLDAVRAITNRSTGRLGCAIAEALWKHGAEVVMLAGETSQVPEAKPCVGGKPIRSVERFYTVSDLKNLLEKYLTTQSFQAVVMAAAVLDYLPVESVEGKKRSEADEWVIRLRRGEKLIERIKSWVPDVCLVGFKLEARIGQEELIARAADLLKRAQADLVVANRLEEIGTTRHVAYLIEAGEKETGLCVSEPLRTREEIAESLAVRLGKRLAGKSFIHSRGE